MGQGHDLRPGDPASSGHGRPDDRAGRPGRQRRAERPRGGHDLPLPPGRRSTASATTVGSDQSFTTPQPPSITSFNATNLTASSADLIATVNPNGYETNYWFEYGTTDQYGTRVPVPDGLLTERPEQRPQHRPADRRPGGDDLSLPPHSRKRMGLGHDGGPDLRLQRAGRLPEPDPAPADRLCLRSRLPGIRARIRCQRERHRALRGGADLRLRRPASSPTPASSTRSRGRVNRRTRPSAPNSTSRPASRTVGIRDTSGSPAMKESTRAAPPASNTAPATTAATTKKASSARPKCRARCRRTNRSATSWSGIASRTRHGRRPQRRHQRPQGVRQRRQLRRPAADESR